MPNNITIEHLGLTLNNNTMNNAEEKREERIIQQAEKEIEFIEKDNSLTDAEKDEEIKEVNRELQETLKELRAD